MKQRVVITLALISVLLMTWGCVRTQAVYKNEPVLGSSAKGGPPPWAPAHGYRAKHRYYYYPASHIYFDIGRKIYFYLEGGVWRAGASIPAGIQVDLKEYLTLEMDTDKPYEFHSDVIKWYPPGHLKDKDKGKSKGKGEKNKGKGK